VVGSWNWSGRRGSGGSARPVRRRRSSRMVGANAEE
jgi:hypothetical protein